MAYSEELAERIRDAIDGRAGVVERKMFGGIAWMVNGNMACGILDEDLTIRLRRDDAAAAQAEEHVGPMDFTGRPMRGCRPRTLGGCRRGLRRVAPTQVSLDG